MKSTRFASVVEKSGKPDVYLMLMEPEKDASLQKAIKANRVMVLHQPASGTDYGTVGFEMAAKGQILVFPKSLKPFEGARVVGVKYDLLEGAPAPKPKAVTTAKEVKAKAPKKGAPKPPKVAPPTSEKVVAFKRPEPEEDEDEDQRVLDLEAGIHQAMELLEAGRQVAAFNVLKRLVE